MENGSVLGEYFEEVQDDPEFWTEYVLLELRTALLSRMKEKGILRSELADRMGKNRSYVSRLLNGYHNSTFRTLVEACVALDCVPQIAFQELESCRKGATLHWYEVGPAHSMSISFAEPEESQTGATYSPSVETRTTISQADKNTIHFPARCSQDAARAA